MKIDFDKKADAVYIEFSSENFFENKKVDDKTIIDFDKNGNILGIEILDVSKRLPKDFLSEVSIKNLISE